MKYLLLFFIIGFIYSQTPATKTINTGQVIEEKWLNQAGSELADIELSSLVSEADEAQTLTQLSGLATNQSNYSARVRGYLRVETSGEYKIKLNGGSTVALSFLLSDGQDIYNQALSISKDISSSQAMSESYYFEAGNLYYFELLRKVGDNTTQADDWSLDLEHLSHSIDLTTGIASQSSTSYDGIASRAIDGNTNGEESFTHTSPNTANAWWQVEMPHLELINQITLFNRTDSEDSSKRLTNFSIILLNELSNEVFRETYYTDGSYFVPSKTFIISATGIEAQTIRVELNDVGTLSLAEVEASLKNQDVIAYDIFSYRGIDQSLEALTITDQDADADELRDSWEEIYNFSLTGAELDDKAAMGDPDLDLFSNYEESIYQTNPYLADTDGDGISDNDEIYTYFTDPLTPEADTDSDGLVDILENIYGTDVNNADTDGDGLSDGDEIAQGKSPFIADNDSLYYYVDNQFGLDSNDGLRSDTPKLTLGSAFSIAIDNSQIIMLPGTANYQESQLDLQDRIITLRPVGSVTLIGTSL